LGQVGNKGFDPLNCATSEAVLKSYREAELKHGRLAMLAAAGWPVSELVQPWLSSALRVPDLLATGEKAPSVLNGGLDKVRPRPPRLTMCRRLRNPCLSTSRVLESAAGVPGSRSGGAQVNPAFFMAAIIFSATLEAVALNRVRTADYTPGDLGFDPLR
jgi:hypothetical protein